MTEETAREELVKALNNLRDLTEENDKLKRENDALRIENERVIDELYQLSAPVAVDASRSDQTVLPVDVAAVVEAVINAQKTDNHE